VRRTLVLVRHRMLTRASASQNYPNSVAHWSWYATECSNSVAHWPWCATKIEEPMIGAGRAWVPPYFCGAWSFGAPQKWHISVAHLVWCCGALLTCAPQNCIPSIRVFLLVQRLITPSASTRKTELVGRRSRKPYRATAICPSQLHVQSDRRVILKEKSRAGVCSLSFL
jgi:hypothetical protein